MIRGRDVPRRGFPAAWTTHDRDHDHSGFAGAGVPGDGARLLGRPYPGFRQPQYRLAECTGDGFRVAGRPVYGDGAGLAPGDAGSDRACAGVGRRHGGGLWCDLSVERAGFGSDRRESALIALTASGPNVGSAGLPIVAALFSKSASISVAVAVAVAAIVVTPL